MHTHVCTRTAPTAASRHTYGHVRAGTDMYVHVHTHTQTHAEDHFPLSRLKLHPPAAHGAVSAGTHRGHAWHVLGTHRGHVGDVPLSAELRSGTHKHTRGGDPPSPSPLRAVGCPCSWWPGHSDGATPAVWHWGSPFEIPAVPWVTSSPASSCPHQRVHTYGCCSDTGGGLCLSPPCDCAHPHMWLWSPTGVAVFVPPAWLCSHTHTSVFTHVCGHSHTHTEVGSMLHTCMAVLVVITGLYTCVAVLTHTHTCGCAHTHICGCTRVAVLTHTQSCAHTRVAVLTHTSLG